ncbi:MAG: glutamate racemase [Muribaculaceae bacterium]|nr:glutamate racemase [Muribaculaceae bacterium]
MKMSPIGIFDSGYGGLSILREIRARLPQYDYLYLGDNARAPYGTRSFDLVYRFTLQAVQHLFDAGCQMVILACNTASAKALRSIQQNDLPMIDPSRRVLGVIRPTVESIGTLTRSRHIALLATPGTIASRSYDLELAKLSPDIVLTPHACPLWVPIIESGMADTRGADIIIHDDIEQTLAADPLIDTLVLGCTHYPLIFPIIRRHTPDHIRILTQGSIVADSLADYLRRHPDMDCRLSRQGTLQVLTTEEPDRFNPMAAQFLDHPVAATHLDL